MISSFSHFLSQFYSLEETNLIALQEHNLVNKKKNYTFSHLSNLSKKTNSNPFSR